MGDGVDDIVDTLSVIARKTSMMVVSKPEIGNRSSGQR